VRHRWLSIIRTAGRCLLLCRVHGGQLRQRVGRDRNRLVQDGAGRSAWEVAQPSTDFCNTCLSDRPWRLRQKWESNDACSRWLGVRAAGVLITSTPGGEVGVEDGREFGVGGHHRVIRTASDGGRLVDAGRVDRRAGPFVPLTSSSASKSPQVKGKAHRRGACCAGLRSWRMSRCWAASENRSLTCCATPLPRGLRPDRQPHEVKRAVLH
jgi:hypothetical protein